jgi:hypothetical protein
MLWLSLLLTCSGLSFFLAAFQVHEKSVLLPLVPLALAAAIAAAAAAATGDAAAREEAGTAYAAPDDKHGGRALTEPSAAGTVARRLYQWAVWPVTAGMLPLLLRDGLGFATAATTGIALFVLSDAVQSPGTAARGRQEQVPATSSLSSPTPEVGRLPWWTGAWSLLDPAGTGASRAASHHPLLRWVSATHRALMGPLVWLSHAALLAAWAGIKPHSRYPDLFPQLLAAVHTLALLWVLVVATAATWQAATECAGADTHQEHRRLPPPLPASHHHQQGKLRQARATRAEPALAEATRPEQVGPAPAKRTRQRPQLRQARTA